SNPTRENRWRSNRKGNTSTRPPYTTSPSTFLTFRGIPAGGMFNSTFNDDDTVYIYYPEYLARLSPPSCRTLSLG
ncbi:hypothetical protein Pcinc_030364, partial [Petrolisthes cinctipes]